MVHTNVIPPNPTGGFKGSPSGRRGVHDFLSTLDKEFGLKATPRVRRGTDIDAGCGQLKAAVKKKEEKEAQQGMLDVGLESSIKELKSFIDQDSLQHQQTPIVGVYEDDDIDETDNLSLLYSDQVNRRNQLKHGSVVDFELHDVVDLDDEDAVEFEDEEFDNDLDEKEVARLIQVVQASFPKPEKKQEEMSILSGPTTTIVNEDFVREAKKKRKKLLKNLKAIDKLKELEEDGAVLNDEQKVKVRREEEWRLELESVEHNLQ